MRAIFYSAIVPALLAIVAVVACVLLGDRGLMLLIGAIVAAFVGVAAWKRPDLVLVLAFAVLLCAPFFLAVGRTPRIYVDQMLLLALYGVTAAKILLRIEPTCLRWSDVLLPAAALAMLGMTLLVNQSPLGSVRGFLEIMCFSMPLCVLTAHIATERTVDMVAKLLAVMIVVITLAGAAELVWGSNPLMEYAAERFEGEFPYISAELAAASGGFYRPYVFFVNPSEAGTVMALCLPFVAVLWDNENRFWCAFAGVALVAGLAFIVVNSTRGVWFSLFVVMFLFLPRFRKGIVLATPVAACGAVLVSLFFRQLSFWERISDYRNLRIRFWYWEQALSHLENNWLLGQGLGNFSQTYLASNPTVPGEFAADVQQVMTVDNVFLMILVEQGLIGLAGFLLFFGFLFARLAGALRLGIARKRPRTAAFAQAAAACLCIYLLCGLLADVHLFNKATKLVFMLAGLGWGAAMNTQEKQQPQ